MRKSVSPSKENGDEHTLGAKHEIVRKNNIRVRDMLPNDFMITKVTMVKSMWAGFETPQPAALEENLRDVLCNVVGHIEDFDTVTGAPRNESSLNNDISDPTAEIEEGHARFKTDDVDHFGNEPATLFR